MSSPRMTTPRMTTRRDAGRDERDDAGEERSARVAGAMPTRRRDAEETGRPRTLARRRRRLDSRRRRWRPSRRPDAENGKKTSTPRPGDAPRDEGRRARGTGGGRRGLGVVVSGRVTSRERRYVAATTTPPILERPHHRRRETKTTRTGGVEGAHLAGWNGRRATRRRGRGDVGGRVGGDGG